MPLDRKRIAARLYPEIVDRPGKRWSSRLRRGLSRLFHTIFHAFFLTILTTLFRNPLGRLNRWSRRHWKGLGVFFAILMSWGSIHVYWYNKLIMLEYDVHTAWAQVEVEQERRYHIQKNVVDLVIGYAEHERSLMVDLTGLRTRMTRGVDGATDDEAVTSDGQPRAPEPRAPEPRAPEPRAPEPRAPEPSVDVDLPNPDPVAPSAPPPEPALEAAEPEPQLAELSAEQLDAMFPEIMLVAEQYPNLRLTENFQQLSEAIISTETRVADRIAAYNKYVNVYTTALKQFPGNIFASVWGFEEYEYYRPGLEAVEFRPMNYREKALRPPEPVTSAAEQRRGPKPANSADGPNG